MPKYQVTWRRDQWAYSTMEAENEKEAEEKAKGLGVLKADGFYESDCDDDWEFRGVDILEDCN